MPLFIVLFLSGYSEASEEIVIRGVRNWSYEGYTRVVVDASGPIKFTQNRLSNPARLYFDLKNSSLTMKINPSSPIGDGILKNVRVGQFKNDTVRVVLDLMEFERIKSFVLKDPHRLVIDVFGSKKPDKATDTKKSKGFVKIKKVVIDPGHGGKDPGAMGPKGLLEKDVVLAVAKKLGAVLKKKYNMEVVFTRDRDVFIPLEERTAIANSNKDSLFISIHTNASKRRKARGIETYTLNWTSDKEAMRVAARENAISLKKMKSAQNELQIILRDLARDNKKNESIRLAHDVQKSMVDALRHDYSDIVNLGVKQALFYVLIGAEMPSILAEIAFISNFEEERRLSDKSYREKIAEAIAEGINTYTTPTKLANPVRRRDWGPLSNGAKKNSDTI